MDFAEITERFKADRFAVEVTGIEIIGISVRFCSDSDTS